MSFLERFKKDPSREEIEFLRAERLKLKERVKNRKDYNLEKNKLEQAKTVLRENSRFNVALKQFKERGASVLNELKKVQKEDVISQKKGFLNQDLDYKNPVQDEGYRNVFSLSNSKKEKNRRVVFDK